MRDQLHLTLVCDHSGSMDGIRADAEGGVNAFLKKMAAIGATLILVEFDDAYDVLWKGEAVGVPEYKLVPRGNTALLDAVGRAMADTGEYLAAIPEALRPNKVVFCVQTDGHENWSKDWTLARVREKVKEQIDKYAWEFVFLGAGLSAFQGEQFGFQHVTSHSGSGSGTRNTYNVMASSVMSYSAGNEMTMPKAVPDDDEEV